MSAALRLPPELLLHVIESLRPTKEVVLRPSDPATRTILAFTLVSRATYPIAIRTLFSHCLYIDSSKRLRLLLLTLHAFASRTETSILPRIDLAPCLTDLFLAPFASHTIDDLPTAQWTYELLSIMSGMLKRLVIDIPLRSLYPDEDHLSVRPKLRAAFEQLTNLEEFTSVRDELYLSLLEPGTGPALVEQYVWAGWPKLRKLALYNVDLDDPRILYSFQKLESLDCVVLTRADGLERGWFRRAVLQIATRRDMRIVTVDAANSSNANDFFLERMNPGVFLIAKNTTIAKHELELGVIPVEPSKEHPMNDEILDCQEWVRDTAVAGELWNRTPNWSRKLSKAWTTTPGVYETI